MHGDGDGDGDGDDNDEETEDDNDDSSKIPPENGLTLKSLEASKRVPLKWPTQQTAENPKIRRALPRLQRGRAEPSGTTALAAQVVPTFLGARAKRVAPARSSRAYRENQSTCFYKVFRLEMAFC